MDNATPASIFPIKIDFFGGSKESCLETVSEAATVEPRVVRQDATLPDGRDAGDSVQRIA